MPCSKLHAIVGECRDEAADKAALTVDNPPVNSFNAAVRKALAAR